MFLIFRQIKSFVLMVSRSSCAYHEKIAMTQRPKDATLKSPSTHPSPCSTVARPVTTWLYQSTLVQIPMLKAGNTYAAAPMPLLKTPHLSPRAKQSLRLIAWISSNQNTPRHLLLSPSPHKLISQAVLKAACSDLTSLQPKHLNPLPRDLST